MTQLSNRERLLRTTRGEHLNNSMRYSIEYSLDIRGNITIWGGMSFYRFEAVPPIDDPKQRVSRSLRPLYEYQRCSPYTARIYQMEQELDGTISDDTLIEEFQKFRQAHPEDGFGMRLSLLTLGLNVVGGRRQCDLTEEEKYLLSLRDKRDDEQEVLDRLLKQERQDILRLWGVDCPPDINSSENYGRRLSQDRGQVSGWFQEEFRRIGGDWEKLWTRH